MYNQFIGSLSSSQVEDLETEEPQSESPDPAPEGPEGEDRSHERAKLGAAKTREKTKTVAVGSPA